MSAITATGGRVLRINGASSLSAALIEAVQTACDDAEGQSGLSLVAVSGVPDDLTRNADLDVSLVSRWERVVRRLERCTSPTVCTASGDCGGLALDVLLATDVRIATPDTKLIVSAYGDATWPGMAAFRLVDQGGIAGVRRAVLFGEPINATAALALGLVDVVTPDTGAAVAATAAAIAHLAGSELAIRRQLMFDAKHLSFEDALGPHLAACDRALRRSVGLVAS